MVVDVFILLWSALINLFRSRARLEAEILVLRQQINVLRRKSSFTRGSNVLRNQFPEHPRLQDQQSSRGPGRCHCPTQHSLFEPVLPSSFDFYNSERSSGVLPF